MFGSSSSNMFFRLLASFTKLDLYLRKNKVVSESVLFLRLPLDSVTITTSRTEIQKAFVVLKDC